MLVYDLKALNVLTVLSMLSFEEQLPNVYGSGYDGVAVSDIDNANNKAAGALYCVSRPQSWSAWWAGSSIIANGALAFDARRYNSTYVNNGVVRPKSHSCKWIIRFK